MVVWAGLLPALILMVYIYRKDRIEKEPVSLIVKLLILGALSTVPAILLEEIAEMFMLEFWEETSVEFIIINTFFGVALAEEYCKYLAVRIGAWKHRAFDYRFDAIVYSVAAALGFAGLENVLYVMDSGLDTAFLRAFTAVPGHAINGLTMGIYLGQAKTYEAYGDKKGKKRAMRRALWVPTIEHGIYDAALSFDSDFVMLFWLVFVIAVDIWAFRAIRRASGKDGRI